MHMNFAVSPFVLYPQMHLDAKKVIALHIYLF